MKLKKSLLVTAFLVLINSNNVFAQDVWAYKDPYLLPEDVPYTSVHKGLEIEMGGSEESYKKMVFDKLDRVVWYVGGNFTIYSSVHDYMSKDLDGQKVTADFILHRVAYFIDVLSDWSASSDFNTLSLTLSSAKNGKYPFDCDTSSFIYIAVLESLFKIKHLPVVLSLCGKHAFIKWKFSDGTYIGWETTAGLGYESSDTQLMELFAKLYGDNCMEIEPGSAAFYALFYFNEGTSFLEAGNTDAALTNYDEALELNPKFYHAYYNRGTVKFTLSDYIGATADFDKAIELSPDPKYYYKRGIVKCQLENYTGALADIDKVIELEPNHKDALTMHRLILQTIEAQKLK